MDSSETLEFEMQTDILTLLENVKCQSSNPSNLKQALLTLATICSSDSQSQDYFRMAGGVKQLKIMLVEGTCPLLVVPATLYCLACAVRQNVNSQNTVLTEQLFTVIHELLSHKDSSDKLVQAAAFLLACVVDGNGKGQMMASETGCLQDLIHLLRGCVDEVCDDDNRWSTITRAIGICVNNPQNEQNQRICCSVLPHVLKFISAESSHIAVRHLLTLLGLVVANSVSNQNRIRNCGGIETLVECIKKLAYCHMSSPSSSVVFCAVSALDACIADNEDSGMHAGKQGLVSILLELLDVQGLKSSEIQILVLALAHVLESTPEYCHLVQHDRSYQKLVSCLMDTRDDELFKAIKYILTLCRTEEGHTLQKDDIAGKEAAGDFEHSARAVSSFLEEGLGALSDQLNSMGKLKEALEMMEKSSLYPQLYTNAGFASDVPADSFCMSESYASPHTDGEVNQMKEDSAFDAHPAWNHVNGNRAGIGGTVRGSRHPEAHPDRTSNCSVQQPKKRQGMANGLRDCIDSCRIENREKLEARQNLEESLSDGNQQANYDVINRSVHERSSHQNFDRSTLYKENLSAAFSNVRNRDPLIIRSPSQQELLRTAMCKAGQGAGELSQMRSCDSLYKPQVQNHNMVGRDSLLIRDGHQRNFHTTSASNDSMRSSETSTFLENTRSRNLSEMKYPPNFGRERTAIKGGDMISCHTAENKNRCFEPVCSYKTGKSTQIFRPIKLVGHNGCHTQVHGKDGDSNAGPAQFSPDESYSKHFDSNGREETRLNTTISYPINQIQLPRPGTVSPPEYFPNQIPGFEGRGRVESESAEHVVSEFAPQRNEEDGIYSERSDDETSLCRHRRNHSSLASQSVCSMSTRSGPKSATPTRTPPRLHSSDSQLNLKGYPDTSIPSHTCTTAADIRSPAVEEAERNTSLAVLQESQLHLFNQFQKMMSSFFMSFIPGQMKPHIPTVNDVDKSNCLSCVDELNCHGRELLHESEEGNRDSMRHETCCGSVTKIPTQNENQLNNAEMTHLPLPPDLAEHEWASAKSQIPSAEDANIPSIMKKDDQQELNNPPDGSEKNAHTPAKNTSPPNTVQREYDQGKHSAENETIAAQLRKVIQANLKKVTCAQETGDTSTSPNQKNDKSCNAKEKRPLNSGQTSKNEDQLIFLKPKHPAPHKYQVTGYRQNIRHAHTLQSMITGTNRKSQDSKTCTTQPPPTPALSEFDSRLKRIALKGSSNHSILQRSRSASVTPYMTSPEYSKDSLCPGCKRGSELNSRTYNRAIETSTETCIYHRSLRRCEKKVIHSRISDHKHTSQAFKRSIDCDYINLVNRGKDIYDFKSSSSEDVFSPTHKASRRAAEVDLMRKFPEKKHDEMKGRRARIPYSKQECLNLLEGVAKMGRRWNQILCTYEFDLRRTAIDLKDKYKRLKASRHGNFKAAEKTMRTKDGRKSSVVGGLHIQDLDFAK